MRARLFLPCLLLGFAAHAGHPGQTLEWTDPAGDVAAAREKFAQIDVVRVTAEHAGAQKLALTIEFVEPLPLKTRTELNVDLFIDIDGKKETGELFDGIGHDLFLCLYLNRGDVKWQSSSLIKSDAARAHPIDVESIQVVKRKMKVVLRSKTWKDGIRFDFIVRPREKQTDLDQIPDAGKGALSVDL